MLTVLVLLGLGVLAARLRWLPDGAPRVLDLVILRLALPGLILARVPSLALTAEAAVPVAVAWGSLVVLAGAVAAAARLRRWDRLTVGTLLLVVPLGNTSFLGIPAVEALLGADHVPYAIVYDQLGSFLALATWGTFVAARWGDGDRPTAAGVLRRVVTFPPFVALVVALLLRPVGVPAPFTDVASSLGAMLTPLAMLAVGMRLALPHARSLEPLAVGLGLRLAFAPALVVLVARLLGADSLAWDTATLEAAMPPMVTAGIVAAASGLDERLSAALVGGGVLAAAVALPAWAAVVS